MGPIEPSSRRARLVLNLIFTYGMSTGARWESPRGDQTVVCQCQAQRCGSAWCNSPRITVFTTAEYSPVPATLIAATLILYVVVTANPVIVASVAMPVCGQSIQVFDVLALY